jgi:hypothetical protein
MERRAFLRLSGIAGILAAQRAPAFAQGTKLHIVRWVDFIPEADVELKRQAPEASKALGAEVQLEFINANDLQPRITAAIQSGSGADIIQMLWNWPQLYANGLLDVSDVADPIGKAQGGFYEVFDAAAKVNGRWLAVPHAVIGNAVAYRVSRGRQEAEGQGQADRAGARAQLRRPADVRLPAAVGLRGRRGRQVRQEGGPQQQGHPGVRQVPAGLLEGRV